MSSDDDLLSQVIPSRTRIPLTPVELTKSLVKILTFHPTLNLGETAAKVEHKAEWVLKHLVGSRLCFEIEQIVLANEMPAMNAYCLARLPKPEQLDWLEKAKTTPAEDFTNQVLARLKKIREERRAT